MTHGCSSVSHFHPQNRLHPQYGTHLYKDSKRKDPLAFVACFAHTFMPAPKPIHPYFFFFNYYYLTHRKYLKLAQVLSLLITT